MDVKLKAVGGTVEGFPTRNKNAILELLEVHLISNVIHRLGNHGRRLETRRLISKGWQETSQGLPVRTERRRPREVRPLAPDNTILGGQRVAFKGGML